MEDSVARPRTMLAIEADGIRLDIDAGHAYKGRHLLSLGADEFSALRLFVEARGRVVSFRALSEGVWPGRELQMHNLRNLLYRLRRKLRGSHDFEAIVGEGYRLIKRC